MTWVYGMAKMHKDHNFTSIPFSMQVRLFGSPFTSNFKPIGAILAWTVLSVRGSNGVER